MAACARHAAARHAASRARIRRRRHGRLRRLEPAGRAAQRPARPLGHHSPAPDRAGRQRKLRRHPLDRVQRHPTSGHGQHHRAGPIHPRHPRAGGPGHPARAAPRRPAHAAGRRPALRPRHRTNARRGRALQCRCAGRHRHGRARGNHKDHCGSRRTVAYQHLQHPGHLASCRRRHGASGPPAAGRTAGPRGSHPAAGHPGHAVCTGQGHPGSARRHCTGTRHAGPAQRRGRPASAVGRRRAHPALAGGPASGGHRRAARAARGQRAGHRTDRSAVEGRLADAGRATSDCHRPQRTRPQPRPL